MPQRGIGLQPNVAELARPPWEIVKAKFNRNAVVANVVRRANGNDRNRVAVGNIAGTMTQGSPERFRGNPGLQDGIPLGFSSGAC